MIHILQIIILIALFSCELFSRANIAALKKNNIQKIDSTYSYFVGLESRTSVENDQNASVKRVQVSSQKLKPFIKNPSHIKLRFSRINTSINSSIILSSISNRGPPSLF